MLKRFYILAVVVSLGFAAIPFFFYIELNAEWGADTGYLYWRMVGYVAFLSLLSSMFIVREATRELGKGKRDIAYQESVWVLWQRLVKKTAWIGLGVVPIRCGVALASAQALHVGINTYMWHTSLWQLSIAPFRYTSHPGWNIYEALPSIFGISLAVSSLVTFALLETFLWGAIAILAYKMRRNSFAILMRIFVGGLAFLLAMSMILIRVEICQTEWTTCEYVYNQHSISTRPFIDTAITETIYTASIGLIDTGVGSATFFLRPVMQDNQGNMGFYGINQNGELSVVNHQIDAFYFRQIIAASLSWAMMGAITWGCLRMASRRNSKKQTI